MLPIAEKYTAEHGDDALMVFAKDLMRGDPDALKAGYTRENAIIATADAFGVERADVAARLPIVPRWMVTEIRAALEGDSNDAEHDALVAVADWLGVDYNPDLGW